MNGALIGSMAVLVIIGAANGVIGGLIGICGIAGFLLPMLYTGALGYSVDQALAYSFLAFLVSGCIGAWQYRREGNLDIPLSVKLGAGSAIGAVAGVALQSMIEKETAKAILYVVVLFSGISILFRMWKEKKSAGQEEKKSEKNLTENIGFLSLLGMTTGAVCALSGAGGPVLVMPLLVVCGVSARTAVGVALFDSVFIAVPSCVGYLARIDGKESVVLLFLIAITHGIGVWVGSRFAGKIPVQGLKRFIAIFSVGISLYMLFVA